MEYKILLLEPYYTGSHKQLMDLLHTELPSGNDVAVDLVTMTGKKWHWRARTSALHFAQNIPKESNYQAILTSSVLPFHEFLALRPEFQKVKKVIYFHENQLVYPVRKSKDRDFQYGYNQILSCMVADVVVFNSHFNMESFLSNLQKFFKLQPDYRPKNLRESIEFKCRVIYFPLKFDRMILSSNEKNPTYDKVGKRIYRILWPHRWEFDKNPGLFFDTLYKLVENGLTNFRLSILGETFTDNSEVFNDGKIRLEQFIDHFGFLDCKSDYYEVLRQSDIVISTAHHEFFGVAMMEAIYLGCFPLCPNRLVYPEILKSSDYLFNTDAELYEKLKSILTAAELIKKPEIDFSLYDWKNLKAEYLMLLK